MDAMAGKRKRAEDDPVPAVKPKRKTTGVFTPEPRGVKRKVEPPSLGKISEDEPPRKKQATRTSGLRKPQARSGSSAPRVSAVDLKNPPPAQRSGSSAPRAVSSFYIGTPR